MPSSAKQAAGRPQSLQHVHERLQSALKHGQFIRTNDSRGKRWECADTGIQKLVINSIDALLDCVSREMSLQDTPMKISFNDICGALESILDMRSESVLRLAADVAVKLVRIVPNSVLKSHETYLIDSLLSHISSRQLQTSVSCATALSLIMPDLSAKKEKEVWEILKGRDSVAILVKNVKDCCGESKTKEYSQQMLLLLGQILSRWPQSRFSVWSDSKLLDVLDELKPQRSLQAAVLSVYSGLARCGTGAKKILMRGKSLLEMMVDCMNCSYSHSLQIEGFKLARTLMLTEQGCVEVMKLCCKPLVCSIVNGMKTRSLNPENLTKNQVLLVKESCELAQITRWDGNHQSYFWKERVDEALLDLLLTSTSICESLCHMSLQEQILALQNGYSDNFLSSSRPLVWGILGGLVANCPEEFCPKTHDMALKLDILIICACLAFAESIRSIMVVQDSRNTVRKSALRAVLMMVYSPCKYIASQARLIFSKVLSLNDMTDEVHTDQLLEILKCSAKVNSAPPDFLAVASLMSLACYARLEMCEKWIIGGLRTLLAFLKIKFSSAARRKMSNLPPHLHNSCFGNDCCHQIIVDWENEDMQMLFGLWCLGELIHIVASRGNFAEMKAVLDEYRILEELEDVCSNTSSTGSRWHAAYILSHFGMYGFPTVLGKKVKKELFMDNNLTDVELVLTEQDSINVHELILSVRCPGLLPQRETDIHGSSRNQVRMSSKVDYQSLLKLMEYIYSGCVEPTVENLKKLKLLTKHCGLQPLLHLVCGKYPRWGSPVPTFDLTCALGPAGFKFSDILLECDTTQLENWTCSSCSRSVPHYHAHRAILASSCEYFRTLFHSEWQESDSGKLTIRGIGWGALTKLVSWLYSWELPKPVFDCVWNNLRPDQKVNEMRAYVELCWLAGGWELEDLYEECFGVVESVVRAHGHLAVELTHWAAELYQPRLGGIAAECLVPLYNQLRNSGDLGRVNEQVLDKVRALTLAVT